MNPTVSFVVPCYKLGHLLADCVASVLAQTYRDFEVLIMDDCSPDDTPEVALSFGDSRVKHVRNETNLGHLRNYNKGVQLACGEYVWLISADDRLLKNHALEKYVSVLQRHPSVGYVCAAAVEIKKGHVPDLAQYSVQAGHDTIFPGRSFLRKLLYCNSVVAASGIVRRKCYQELGMFPLDLPYAGDWYLWCLFALHYDVGYCAEPLVGYRIHEGSMTEHLVSKEVHVCVEDCLKVLWRVKRQAEKANCKSIVSRCNRAIGSFYAREIIGTHYRDRQCVMTFEECERSIRGLSKSSREAQLVLGRLCESLADLSLQQNDRAKASMYYRLGIQSYPWAGRMRTKDGLLRMGKIGDAIRTGVPGALHKLRRVSYAE